MLAVKRCMLCFFLCCFGGANGGEIIVAPAQQELSGQSEAARLKDIARQQRKGQPAAGSVIVIELPPEDEVSLSPPRSSGPGSDNAVKARTYRQGDVGALPALMDVPDGSLPANGDAAQQARSNRTRAVEYRKGEHPNGSLTGGGQGVDGLPFVDCRATENAAGRIGDDVAAGNIVVIVQGRKQIKARCR